ncbi:polyphosphate polymerase domain-containing protein [Micromonospora rubida]|uniref:Polyphosphate polymerase domain-containing protein n=1 Tax=Micromonospora rubida TaxID=2697657 RepID=A0ABW7SPK1_9ACTN
MSGIDAATAFPALATLHPIDLEELLCRATLQTRVDRKYVLPLASAGVLLAGMARTARILEIDKQRCFGYESLYYDTPELTTYLLATQGRRRRFKVRRRVYLDSGVSYLEVKTCGIRGNTVKQRRPYDATASDELTDEDRSFVAEVLRKAGIKDARYDAFCPTLRTSYRRSTLYLPDSNSRITVDTDVTWALRDGTRLNLEGVSIIETKAAGSASVADRQLWALGHRPCRISKYCTGLAAFRDDLPANKWRAIMRRHPALRPPDG